MEFVRRSAVAGEHTLTPCSKKAAVTDESAVMGLDAGTPPQQQQQQQAVATPMRPLQKHAVWTPYSQERRPCVACRQPVDADEHVLSNGLCDHCLPFKPTTSSAATSCAENIKLQRRAKRLATQQQHVRTEGVNRIRKALF